MSPWGHGARLSLPQHSASWEKSPSSGHGRHPSCWPFFLLSIQPCGWQQLKRGDWLQCTDLLESSRTFYPYSSKPENYKNMSTDARKTNWSVICDGGVRWKRVRVLARPSELRGILRAFIGTAPRLG